MVIDKKYNLQIPNYDTVDNFRDAREVAMYLCFKYVKIITFEKARRFYLTYPALYVRCCYDYEQYIEDKPEIKKDIKAIVDKLKLEEE